jgi:hypothetical protein
MGQPANGNTAGPNDNHPHALDGSPPSWAGNPNLHHYQHDYAVCGTGQSFCNEGFARNLFENGLRYHPAPGMTGEFQVNTGTVAVASVFGMRGLGRVTFFVNQNALTIRNETLADHDFHPGWVRRSLVFENDQLILRTVGEGIGPLRGISEAFSNQVWGSTNADVFWHMAGLD